MLGRRKHERMKGSERIPRVDDPIFQWEKVRHVTPYTPFNRRTIYHGPNLERTLDVIAKKEYPDATVLDRRYSPPLLEAGQ